MSENHPHLLIVGGGNMASALVRGMIGARFDPARISVVEPIDARRSGFASLGVQALASIESANARQGPHDPSAHVLLAVKPQVLPTIAAALAPLAGGRTVISILAGTPIARVRALLGDARRVIRAMPNLPAGIGLGATALCTGAGTRPGDDSFAARIFESVGVVVRLPEEHMDTFTALAGSGPAYVFRLAEAMLAAAARLGLDEHAANVAVRQTILGAAALLSRSSDSPAALRAAVTSPGGTTEAASRVLDACAVDRAFIEAITAARDRGAELSRA
ncbi:MAG: pyrroline-5-carboxylate reductase [Phycisphaerales bacterium]